MGCDCSVAIGMVKDCLDGGGSETTIRQIADVARHFEAFETQAIGRNGNLVEDLLAKSCVLTEDDVRIIETPNDEVQKLLLNDLAIASDV